MVEEITHGKGCVCLRCMPPGRAELGASNRDIVLGRMARGETGLETVGPKTCDRCGRTAARDGETSHEGKCRRPLAEKYMVKSGPDHDDCAANTRADGGFTAAMALMGPALMRPSEPKRSPPLEAIAKLRSMLSASAQRESVVGELDYALEALSEIEDFVKDVTDV
jgi:hypothetical protein